MKKDIEICKLQIELSEVQEKLNARMNDSERIVMLEHEVLKLGELMQGRDAGFVNQKTERKQVYEYGAESEWPNLNEMQKKKKDHEDERRYTLNPSLRSRQEVNKMERKEIKENNQVNIESEDNRRRNLGEDSERSSQEAEVSDKEDQGSPWEKVVRKRSRQKQKKMPIMIFGDSMVKDLKRNISMKEEGSELYSYAGAQIGVIAEKVKEKCINGGDGLIIIQGGGNNLTAIGYQETVEKVLSTVKEITKSNKNRKVGVMGIIKRPREYMSDRYDEERRKANRVIQTELCRMKEEKMQVSFIDMDPVIQNNMFRLDGVHLNVEGNDKMSARILTWMRQKETRITEGNRK